MHLDGPVMPLQADDGLAGIFPRHHFQTPPLCALWQLQEHGEVLQPLCRPRLHSGEHLISFPLTERRGVSSQAFNRFTASRSIGFALCPVEPHRGIELRDDIGPFQAIGYPLQSVGDRLHGPPVDQNSIYTVSPNGAICFSVESHITGNGGGTSGNVPSRSVI